MTTRREKYAAYETGGQKLPGSGLRRLTDFSPYANKVSTRVYDDDGRALQTPPCRLVQQAVPFDLPPSFAFILTIHRRPFTGSVIRRIDGPLQPAINRYVVYA